MGDSLAALYYDKLRNIAKYYYLLLVVINFKVVLSVKKGI